MGSGDGILDDELEMGDLWRRGGRVQCTCQETQSGRNDSLVASRRASNASRTAFSSANALVI